jgi:CheY-like chemotaxis protein
VSRLAQTGWLPTRNLSAKRSNKSILLGSAEACKKQKQRKAKRLVLFHARVLFFCVGKLFLQVLGQGIKYHQSSSGTNGTGIASLAGQMQKNTTATGCGVGKDANLPVPKVLVIDDEEAVRAVLGRALKEQGYQVEVAVDGLEGMQIFQRQPADLVIVDLYMPKKDGVETVIEIHQIQPDVKVVAISGGGLTGNLELLNHTQTFGAVCTFAKPFKLNELLLTVKELIGPGSLSS